MTTGTLCRFARNEAASTTPEFVVVVFFFFIIVFFVMEVAIALFFWQTVEKSVQLGARLTIVSAPVEAGVPSTNGYNGADGTLLGDPCSDSPTPCTGFATVTCTGTACTNTADFNRILSRMRQLYAGIGASNVTFTYEDVGLGFAGGPTVPLVTVTIAGVPFQTGMLSIMGRYLGDTALTTIPTMTATLTGEDLRL